MIRDGVLSRLNDDEDSFGQLEEEPFTDIATLIERGVPIEKDSRISQVPNGQCCEPGDFVKVQDGPYVGAMGKVIRVSGPEVVINSDQGMIRVLKEYVGK